MQLTLTILISDSNTKSEIIYVEIQKAPNLKLHTTIFYPYVMLDVERLKYGHYLLKLLLCNNIAPTYFGKESFKPYYL